jgi:uncharacterized membrane protein
MLLRFYARAGYILCGVAALVIALATFVYWRKIAGYGFVFADRPEDWAYLGEYFGGLTAPLVSLFALIALAINLHLQARQLQQAKADAATQRSVAARQATVSARQAFEGTFFPLLNQFVGFARNVHESALPGAEPFDGVRYFDLMMRTLRQKYKNRIVYSGDYKDDERLSPQIYGKLYQKHQDQLGPYFRNLYHLFKFIDKSDRSDDEKINDANMVRAQLSINEALLVFYNGTWGEGEDFKPLIQRYGILKHVPSKYLLNPGHMANRDWYKVSAFQDAEDRKDGSPTPSKSNARVSDDDFDPDVDWESI